jgi:hypothetical protein
MKNSKDVAFLKYFCVFIIPVVLVFREYYVLFCIFSLLSILFFTKTKLFRLIKKKAKVFVYLTIIYILSACISLAFHWYEVKNIYEVVVVMLVGFTTFPIFKKYRVHF